MRGPDQPVFCLESRRINLQRLGEGVFDVLILGGGINGAGIARDLASRAKRAGIPFRVGLVEKQHFASGTSGKNSQLIHGGLRYLKQMEFRLVREALRERATLLNIAPHLVEPLPFLIPMYGSFARLFYGTGLWLYDILAGSKSIGRRRFYSRSEIAQLEPGLSIENLTAGAVFYDCRIHSARFVLENIWDAARSGAVITNYVRAGNVTPEGEAGYRVRVLDALSGESFEVKARKLVDATGPWERGQQLRLVRGSHIILPRVNASENAIAYFDESGRIVFVIPWGASRQLSLVGTTDRDHLGTPDEVHITADEVEYLLRIVRRLFPASEHTRPIAAYSSLRPLLQSGSGSPTKTSREHRIWSSGDGVWHVAGGKYTTYRIMSEEASNAIARQIAPALEQNCLTANTPLNGNSKERIQELLSSAPILASRHNMETEEAIRVIRDYGMQSPNVLECLPQVSPSSDLTRLQVAQIAFAVNHEMAQRLPDLLFISTYWGYERAWTAGQLAPIANEMGKILGWSAQKTEEEVALYLHLAKTPD